MKTIKGFLTHLLLAFSVLVLFACGGGAGGTGSQGSASTTPTLSISLRTITTSPTNTDALSAGQAARATAVYKTANGQAIPNAVVTFSLSDATLATMSPVNGTAITDSAGVAFVDIVGKSPNPGGALSISAKASNGADTINSPVWNVSVVASTVSTSAAPKITVVVFDSTGTNPSISQPAGSTALAKATVQLADGTPVVNQLVNFKLALDATLVSMTPQSGNVLTDSNGVATVSVNAKVPSAGGAYSIEATSSVSGSAVNSVPAYMTVGSAQIIFGAPSLVAGTPSPLPASSIATIQTPVTSNGLAVATASASSISASSACASQSPAKATITVVGVTNGIATVNYQNLGCSSSPDQVTISMTGASSPVSISIPVSAAVASKLTYVGATPTSNVLVVKGAGGLGRVETGVVSFKLEDASGNPVANETVTFSLNTIAGGITLTTNSPITNSSGVASVRVNSGSLPTPLTVLAKVVSAAGTLTAASSVLSISAGPPEQRSMSLSVGAKAIEGWSIDGVITPVTIRMADYWGNAVPDGTAVSFISEGASITNPTTSNGSCLTLNGECSMSFRSQNFRPNDGRVTITAYAEGLESYIDANGNGVFDTGESCSHSGAPYLDNNESGAYEAATDLRISNIAPSSDTPKAAAPCTSRAPTYVFAQTVIVLSTSEARLQRVFPLTPLSFAACQAIDLTFRLFDANPAAANPPAAGSTVAVSDALLVTSGAVFSAKVLSQTTPSTHSVTLAPDTTKCGLSPASAASFNIVVTSPSGIQSVFPFFIPY